MSKLFENKFFRISSTNILEEIRYNIPDQGFYYLISEKNMK